MTSAVSFQRVRKCYGDLCALNDITLEIPQGSFFGLLGHNGAGKSTLINAMAGLVNLTRGRIEVLGHDVVREYRHTRRLLGVVPQELIDEPFFSVRELLRIQSGYFGLRGRAQSAWIDELLQRLALADKADVKTHQLSGGMKRRVLIAMALVHHPKVLVLDEPTAGVDVGLRQSLWAFAQELHAQGMTIVLTTHYLQEAEALCDRIAIIDHGELLTVASKEELLAAHPWRYIELETHEVAELCPELSARLEQRQGDLLRFRVERDVPMADFLDWVQRSHLDVKDLRSQRASLEQVFLSLTQEAQP
jgi:ABC-2 type transport system ATP-binding protein